MGMSALMLKIKPFPLVFAENISKGFVFPTKIIGLEVFSSKIVAV
jgi:hypothetical protein